jgi:salicylate hydroxylase
MLNLVAVTDGSLSGETWSGQADRASLEAAASGSARPIRELVAAVAGWTVWPIHTVDFDTWTLGASFALIGDAAHATTPFAAQGAAMAIEDAATLAQAMAGPADAAAALAAWQSARKARMAKVVRRGAINRFAWHASGPIALARDVLLGMRSSERLAADLDWLYGWRMPGPTTG